LKLSLIYDSKMEMLGMCDTNNLTIQILVYAFCVGWDDETAASGNGNYIPICSAWAKSITFLIASNELISLPT
jgi:hypothetical protein